MVTGSSGLLGDNLLSVRVLRLGGERGVPGRGGSRCEGSVRHLNQNYPLSVSEHSRSRRSQGLKRRSRDGEASAVRAGTGKGDEARR